MFSPREHSHGHHRRSLIKTALAPEANTFADCSRRPSNLKRKPN